MRTVVLADGTRTQFHTPRLHVGQWWQDPWDDHWHIVTSCKPGEAVDEHGEVDIGFFITLREPTTEELEDRERQKAAWQALSPDQRTEIRLTRLAAAFPTLDWGD